MLSQLLECHAICAIYQHSAAPRPALKALELLGGSAASSVFIGDASVDIMCGAGAGMDTAWVPHGVGYLEPGVSPTHLMLTVGDLLRWA